MLKSPRVQWPQVTNPFYVRQRGLEKTPAWGLHPEASCPHSSHSTLQHMMMDELLYPKDPERTKGLLERRSHQALPS